MTQQERILSLAQEKIACIGQGNSRQWGNSFKAGFDIAVKFTLENLWISVDESLPELPKELPSSAVSEIVLIKCVNGAITRARYVKILGDFTTYVWQCVDAGFGVGNDKVTHWMPIPPLKISKIANQGEVSHIWKDGSGRLISDYERNIAVEKYKKGGEKCSQP